MYSILSRTLFFTLLIVAALEANSLSAAPVYMDSTTRINLVEHLEYYSINGNRSFEEMKADRSGWKPMLGSSINFGYTSKQYWFRFKLIPSTADNHIYLIFSNHRIDSIRVLIPTGDKRYKIFETGDHYKSSSREINSPNYVYEMKSVEGDSIIYFSIKSTGSLRTEVFLSNASQTLNALITSSVIWWFYFGWLTVLSIYCLLVYISIKEKSFLYGFFFIGAIVLSELSNAGYIHYFVKGNIEFFQDRMEFLAGLLASLTGIFFVNSYSTKYSFKNRNYRRGIVVYLSAAVVLFIMVVYAYDSKIFLIPFYLFCTVAMAVMIILIIRSGLKNNKVMIFLLAAFGLMIVAQLIRFAVLFGLISGNVLTDYALQIGYAALIVITSLSLANQINLIKNELAVVNRTLESRVEERSKMLQSAQGELIEKAHQAGMAEVANGTLHNVGNILNSIQTSCYLLKNMQAEGAAEKLEKANLILRENMNTIDEFLKTVKGKMLLDYYFLLEKMVKEEKSKVISIAANLDEKVNLIVDIISTQQNVARYSNVNESADVVSVINDVLLMEKGSIDKYSIQVVKRIGQVSPVLIQKSKVMHILFNLFNNSKEAMLPMEPLNRTLTIAVREDDENVVVEIKDTGVGIDKENMLKIFTHGFTTKKNGHGFGLHSCAKYMTEMGGSIQVESDGKGLGTTMSLRFKKACDQKKSGETV